MTTGLRKHSSNARRQESQERGDVIVNEREVLVGHDPEWPKKGFMTDKDSPYLLDELVLG